MVPVMVFVHSAVSGSVWEKGVGVRDKARLAWNLGVCLGAIVRLKSYES